MRQVALLRAVNVGGRSVPMAELRDCATALGLNEVRSLLQTGNLLFEADTGGVELEARLEAAIQARFGLAADVILRTASEWAQAISANPFGDAAREDPSHLVLMALKAAPTADCVEALRGAVAGRETVQAVGRDLYLVYPDGIGPSKLTISVIERKLGVRGTARNWNTALKIAATLG